MVGVVDEDAAVGWIAGMESDAEESLLVGLGPDAVGDVKEGIVTDLPVMHHQNPALLLDDKQPPAGIAGVADVNGAIEAGGHDLNIDAQSAGRGRLGCGHDFGGGDRSWGWRGRGLRRWLWSHRWDR